MEQSKIGISNQSQIVRLPKPVAFPPAVRKVNVIEQGRTRLLVPAGEAWDSWFDGPSATADFMAERDQPEDQQRTAF